MNENMENTNDTKPWLEQVKPELREHEAIKEVADVNDLALRHIQMVGEYSKVKGELGSMIKVPGESATDEEKAAWRSAVGVPSKPEEYEIPVPEGQSTKLADWARGVFHKADISKESAKILATEWNGFLNSLAEARENERVETLKAGMKELEAEWKNDFKGNTEVVKRVQEAVMKSNPKMGEWLTAHNAENEPVLIRFLYEIAPHYIADFNKEKPNPSAMIKGEDGQFHYPDM